MSTQDMTTAAIDAATGGDTIDTSSLIYALSLARNESTRVEAHLASLREKESALRNRLHERMQSEGVKTVEGHGLQLVRSNRKSVNVTDEDALTSYIDKQGMKPLYMTTPRFDAVRAKKDAVKNNWPGVEEVVTDVLSVRGVMVESNE